MIWNVNTGKECCRLLHDENGTGARRNDIEKISFSPDGKILATATPELLTLWDVESGKRQFTTRDLRHHRFEDLVFSPRGRLLACVTAKTSDVSGKAIPKETVVELWDISTKKHSGQLPVPNGSVRLAFSPDGQHLAAACSDNSVRIFQITTAKQEGAFAVYKGGYTYCIAY